jgi:hypothetical protein
MKNKIVVVPAIAKPIAESPGFAKKQLSEFKLDILALCGYGELGQLLTDQPPAPGR